MFQRLHFCNTVEAPRVVVGRSQHVGSVAIQRRIGALSGGSQEREYALEKRTWIEIERKYGFETG